MKRALFAMLFCVLLTGADWEPAQGPLTTKWAKDVTPDKVHPEYPRPQMVRKDWQNLNGLWEFAFAKKGDEPPVGKKLDGQILVPFPVESALSGVMKTAEPNGDGLRAWYRRTFEVKKEWAGKRLLLHFGAVNWEATVWVNGKKLDTHKGGYDGFSLDITDALKKDGAQEVVVGVWNPIDSGTQPRGKQVRKPGGIFYTASTGIWQTVWLEAVPKAHLTGLKIVPDVDGKKVRLTVTVDGTGPGHLLLVNAGSAGARALPEKEFELPIRDPKLWAPENPFLYDLRVQLLEPGGDAAKVVDVVDCYFAMRKIEIGKDDKGITRLFLNGKPYFQVGPLDQGFWPDGLYTAPTDEALRYDIEITKKLGFNMIRKHVKVESERWYYWCDKLGVLVWQDMPSGDKSVAPGKGEITRSPESAKQFEDELERMIKGRGNHPCIVLWVPFNEGWGQYDTKRIVEKVRELDPHRLVDCASGWNDVKGAGDVHDIHVYPGPGSPEPEEKRAAVLGEFGGLGLPLAKHLWTDKNWGYQNTRDGADLTRKYESLLRRVWDFKDKPGLSAAVYTQTTDVETEVNGLLTYDRAVIKVDVDRIAAVNRGDFSRVPIQRDVVSTSKEKPVTWQYTFEKPGEDWFKPDFEARDWKKGEAGFGTRGTPGAVVQTEWKTPDVWLRREFSLDGDGFNDPHLLIHHDEDAEVYIDGVLAAKVTGFTTAYEVESISKEAKAKLTKGKHVLAVHCHQTGGGQYIDVGLVDLKKKE